MSKLKEFLIHLLGGFTLKECEAKQQEASEKACACISNYLSTPIVRINSSDQTLNVMVSVAIESGIPTEYIKRQLCSKLSDTLINDNLMAFDIADSHGLERGKIYRGSLNVLLPRCFASHK